MSAVAAFRLRNSLRSIFREQVQFAAYAKLLRMKFKLLRIETVKRNA